MSEDLEHKFLGAGIGKWGNDTWSTEVYFTDESAAGRTLVSVQAAFAFLLLAGLLAISFFILILRRSRKNSLRPMPLITTLGAMFSMVVAMTNIFVDNIIILHTSKAKNYYLICEILSFLFEPASYCITFYVFYTIIHVFIERLSGTNIPKWKTQMLEVTKYVHWAIVGLFAGLIIVSWSWFILWRNYLVFDEIIFARKKIVWNKIDSARCILFWLAAWEVLGWGFYLGLMTSRDPSQVKFKMSAYFLIAASGFFLAINFLFFVWDVIYYLKDDSLPSDLSAGTEVTQEVLRFVFVQGCFFALCLCYWRFPEPDPIAKKSDEIEPNYGIIDRTRMEPREIDTGESAIGNNEKQRRIHEANDSSQILEADGSNPISEKKVVLEADSAHHILEADSNILYEKV